MPFIPLMYKKPTNPTFSCISEPVLCIISADGLEERIHEVKHTI